MTYYDGLDILRAVAPRTVGVLGFVASVALLTAYVPDPPLPLRPLQPVGCVIYDNLATGALDAIAAIGEVAGTGSLEMEPAPILGC